MYFFTEIIKCKKKSICFSPNVSIYFATFHKNIKYLLLNALTIKHDKRVLLSEIFKSQILLETEIFLLKKQAKQL